MSVHYQVEDDVALITLARPDRFNSVSADLSKGLIAALAQAGSEARAAVLTGSGKAFCAGADLSDLMTEYDSGGPDLNRIIGERFNPIAEALVTAQVPTVAAINGVAAGAGMGIALGCDLRVMSSEAFFISAFIGLGLIPDTGSTWLLVHHLGLSRAMEFTTTNRRLSAPEAAQLGLAEVVAADQLMNRALELSATLAGGPTSAYVANRRVLYDATGPDGLTAALERERSIQGELGLSANHLEGMKAFLDKRPANFGKGD